MTPLRLGLSLIAAACIALTASGGTSAPTQHDVIFIASEQQWGTVGDPSDVYSCTRSQNAPACPLGENTAQAVSDLLNAGFHVDPNLQPTNPYGIVLVRP